MSLNFCGNRKDRREFRIHPMDAIILIDTRQHL